MNKLKKYLKPKNGNNKDGVENPSHFSEDSLKKPKNLDAGEFKSIISTLFGFLIAFTLFYFFITSFVIQSYQVDGQSMQSTLQNNDRLIVDKIPRTLARITGHAYIPHRGDIIIFNQANLPGYVGEKQLVKRVVGLPDDRVVVKNGYITIYNSSHPHGFNPDTTSGYSIAAPITAGSVDVKLGPNQIFVSGDNRTNSEDSRDFGPVNVNAIDGKLVLRVFPLARLERF